jgi:hypothetical protein
VIGVPVSDIQHQYIGTGGEQFGGTIFFALSDTNRCPYAQAPLIITGSGGKRLLLTTSCAVINPTRLPWSSMIGSFSRRCS